MHYIIYRFLVGGGPLNSGKIWSDNGSGGKKN
jgi:hypothetical protein